MSAQAQATKLGVVAFKTIVGKWIGQGSTMKVSIKYPKYTPHGLFALIVFDVHT